jgi:serine/threonine protein kinase
MSYIATAEFPYESKTEFDLRRDFEHIGTPRLPEHYSESFQDFIDCALAIKEEDRWSAFELLVRMR